MIKYLFTILIGLFAVPLIMAQEGKNKENQSGNIYKYFNNFNADSLKNRLHSIIPKPPALFDTTRSTPFSLRENNGNNMPMFSPKGDIKYNMPAFSPDPNIKYNMPSYSVENSTRVNPEDKDSFKNDIKPKKELKKVK